MRPDIHVKKPCDPGWLRPSRWLGLRVADRILVMVVSVSTWGLLPGCLITEDLKFHGQVDAPPALVFQPRSKPPIGATLRVDTDAFEAMNETELEFSLQVRDQNLEQDLETQIRLRTLVASPAYTEVKIRDVVPGPKIVGTGELVRDVTFPLLTTELRDGHCHQLQLAVSGKFIDPSQFDERLFAGPVQSGDVTIATWWLWETSTPVDLETCPSDDF